MRFKSLLLMLLIVSIAQAQTKDDNVVITNATELYSFEEDNGLVFVKEKTERYYEATQRATTISISEMYNDQVSLDKVKAKRNSTIKYSLYTTDDMFYSDAKICYFDLNFYKKGEKAEVKFEKTYKDPRYFTDIYFSEMVFVKEKTVTIDVPSWMKVELIEKNFTPNIKKEVKVNNKDNSHTYVYTITDLPAYKMEGNMPGRSYIYPHIQVLVKSADLKMGKETYFETLDDQYAWYYNIIQEVNNDEKIIEAKAKEIIIDCKTDRDKIKALYAWVQDHIRYIAFEDGIAGFKPDDAQEVLRKKYGDCKGMANLVKTLLKTVGFDARLAWIGTNHIAYDYSTPSLAVDNHMICALFFEGKTYYLDPTVKYMPLGEYPHTIQGRQTLIEDGEDGKYILARVPEFSPQLNTDSTSFRYVVEGGLLKGEVERYFRGESKQKILSLMDATPKDKLNEAVNRFLENGNQQDNASNIVITGADSQSEEVKIVYDEVRKTGIQFFDNECYIDLDLSKEFSASNIDLEERVNDIEFSHKFHIIKDVTLDIPDGYTVSYLPEPLDIITEGYRFNVTYQEKGSTVIYRRELTIKKLHLEKDGFKQWNDDIAKLKKHYAEQIVLTK